MSMCASVLSWSRRCGGMVTLAAVLLVLVANPVFGRMQGDGSQDSPANLLENFVHYVLTGQADLAEGYGQALLDTGMTNADMARLVDDGTMDETRFQEAISWGQRVDEIEPIVSEVAIRVERGRLDLARDADRIAEAIEMLGGTAREELLAMNRLAAAGEYAVPKLLAVITDGQDERVKPKAERALVSIGKQAVDPLCVALPSIDTTSQRRVCAVLGSIGWPHAGPTLAELMRADGTPAAVSAAAERAFAAIGGDGTMGLSEMWTTLGRQYFDDPVSLVAYPTDDRSNVWSFDPFVGLVTTPVPTEVYGDVRAMQLAMHAMSLDATNEDALALFVAANLDRENGLPTGEDDPVFGDLPYTPSFYATVFGTRVCQDVLAMALDNLNTPLVRDAIRALSETTGGGNLFEARTSRRPLLETLTYTDRRVQYEGALALGRALPDRSFSGDQLVVPILASAVRTAGVSYGVVVAGDTEVRQTMADFFAETGFTTVASELTFADAVPAIEQSVAVDLIVLEQDSNEQVMETIETIRSYARTLATPVLVRVPPADLTALQVRFVDDARVMIVPTGGGASAFSAGVEQLLDAAVGGRLGDADAEVYAIEALSTLEDIAINRGPAFNVADAEPALLEALSTREGGMRMLVADILALIGTGAAQQALFDAALSESDEFDQIELLDRVAASVRRFGNMSEARHREALTDLIVRSDGDTAEAAARVHGALNVFDGGSLRLLPSTN